jgi:hypothetical protein
MRFDLHARKTEREWSVAYHAFWKTFVEGAFRVLGWSTAAAALKLLATKSSSVWLNGAYYVAHGLIIAYLASLANNGIELVIFKEDQPLTRWKMTVTIAANLAVIFPIWWSLTTTSAAIIAAVAHL